jgi:hypothetical protein
VHGVASERFTQLRSLYHAKHAWVHPNQPQSGATLTLSLLAFGQHLQGCVLKIENSAEITGNDPRLRFFNQDFYLLRDWLSIGEENPALQSQQQQADKRLILGVFL